MTSTITKIELLDQAPENVSLYHVHCGHEWGFVPLMTRDTAVHVMANSSYGSYAYYWGSTGPNPLKFLTEIDIHYAMNKLTNGNYKEPDMEARQEEVKQLIIERRREKEIDKDNARDAWNDLLKYHIDWSMSPDVVAYQLVESVWFDEVFSDYQLLPRRMMIKSECQGFWDHIWTPLMQELKEEIANG